MPQVTQPGKGKEVTLTQTCRTTTRVFWLRMVEEALLGGAPDPRLRAWALASSVPCQNEWRYLLSGGSVSVLSENPAPDWLTDRAWRDIQALSNLPAFSSFAHDFVKHLPEFRAIFDSHEPHR